LERIQTNLRAFIGATAFEDLCRQWVMVQGKQGELPFTPTAIGSYWSKRVQADVVAINWENKQVLLGECKWGADKIDRQVALDLINEKTRKLRLDLSDMGQGWKIHHALFARQGFTDATKTEMNKVGGLCVDLKQIDAALAAQE